MGHIFKQYRNLSVAKCLIPISFSLANILAISGCGTQSNPASNYQDVVQSHNVPAGKESKGTVSVLTPSDFYTITADGASYQKDLIFREGSNNTHTLVVKFMLPDVQYNLVVAAPQGPTIARSPQAPDTWILSYPLPAVVLSEGEDPRPFDLQLQIQILPGTSPASAASLNEINLISTIGGEIWHGKAGPKITQVAGVDTPMNEGEARAITIDVIDPSSGDKIPPTLQASAGNIDNQSTFADGSVYIRHANGTATPESLGHGAWRFHLLIDTKDIKLDHSKQQSIASAQGAKGVNLQFAFKVQSRSGSSTIVTHEAVLLKIPQPTPTPAPQPKPSPTPKPHVAHAKPAPTPKPLPSPNPSPTPATQAGAAK